MAKQARYTLHVPTQDQMGNALMDVSRRTHALMANRGIGDQAHVTGPHRHLDAGRQTPTEHLITYLDDTPENDSHMKQIAGYVGQAVNHEATTLTKDSTQGPQVFVIANPSHRPGFPAPATRPKEFTGADHYQGLQAFK